jgi:hypothetical protein
VTLDPPCPPPQLRGLRLLHDRSGVRCEQRNDDASGSTGVRAFTSPSAAAAATCTGLVYGGGLHLNRDPSRPPHTVRSGNPQRRLGGLSEFRPVRVVRRLAPAGGVEVILRVPRPRQLGARGPGNPAPSAPPGESVAARIRATASRSRANCTASAGVVSMVVPPRSCTATLTLPRVVSPSVPGVEDGGVDHSQVEGVSSRRCGGRRGCRRPGGRARAGTSQGMGACSGLISLSCSLLRPDWARCGHAP